MPGPWGRAMSAFASLAGKFKLERQKRGAAKEVKLVDVDDDLAGIPKSREQKPRSTALTTSRNRIPFKVSVKQQRCSWAPGSGQGLASRPEVTLPKEKGGQKVGGHDHHHHGCMSLEGPLPSAPALSTTLKYFHLLWELPDQLPVVLGIFFFSFFFF